jgi:hypothetical protein
MLSRISKFRGIVIGFCSLDAFMTFLWVLIHRRPFRICFGKFRLRRQGLSRTHRKLPIPEGRSSIFMNWQSRIIR